MNTSFDPSHVVPATKRTTQSVQNDTLDYIAYRIFGQRSQQLLPKLIELNPNFQPHAIIPMGSTVILPDDSNTSIITTVKLWD